MKTNNKQGSALLMVLLITSLLSLYFFNYMKMSIYSNSLAQKREHYEWRYWVTQALLEWGIHWIKENSLKEQNNEPSTLFFDRWPPASSKKHSGLLTFKHENNKILVTASLIEKEIEVYTANSMIN